MRISKKILTIILSIGLLVVISCGDRPTGSGDVDNQINALFDSIPNPTGTPAPDLTSATYTNKLTAKIEYVPQGEGESFPQEIYLEITKDTVNNNKVTGGITYKDESGNPQKSPFFTDGILSNDNNGKYFYRKVEEKVENFEGGKTLTSKHIHYIEFTKPTDGKITFTYINATSQKGDMPLDYDENYNPIGGFEYVNYGNKITCSGDLIEEVQSGSGN